MQDYFSVDGVRIKNPSTYKPVFATTSTNDSDRTQDLVMHNTPMGTIQGYDITWEELTSQEISTILGCMMNKPQFSVHHRCPLKAAGWDDAEFYASNFNMEAQCLKEGEEVWKNMSVNIRSIKPV